MILVAVGDDDDFNHDPRNAEHACTHSPITKTRAVGAF